MLCACWPDLIPAMLTLAWMVGHRWVKNMNQGTEGSEVDDLLQLSYLQRLARQKVAEMEVPLSSTYLLFMHCSSAGGKLRRLPNCSMFWHLLNELSSREVVKNLWHLSLSFSG